MICALPTLYYCPWSPGLHTPILFHYLSTESVYHAFSVAKQTQHIPYLTITVLQSQSPIPFLTLITLNLCRLMSSPPPSVPLVSSFHVFVSLSWRQLCDAMSGQTLNSSWPGSTRSWWQWRDSSQTLPTSAPRSNCSASCCQSWWVACPIRFFRVE